MRTRVRAWFLLEGFGGERGTQCSRRYVLMFLFPSSPRVLNGNYIPLKLMCLFCRKRRSIWRFKGEAADGRGRGAGGFVLARARVSYIFTG